MIIVDTSVWIDFFRGRLPEKDALQELAEGGGVAMASFVCGELLQGAKGSREVRVLTEYWNALPRLDESEIWIDAGNLSRAGKFVSKGIGLIDAAIIAFARRHGGRVWSFDLSLLAALQPNERYGNDSL